MADYTNYEGLAAGIALQGKPTVGWIYCLIDPRDNLPKYIGKSGVSVGKRYQDHIRPSGLIDPTKKNNWIKHLIANNLKPILDVIDEIPQIELDFWEQHYISLYRSWGFDLKNMTHGGDGGLGRIVTPEVREKHRASMKGRKPSQKTIDAGIEHNKKMVGAKNHQYGKTHNPETISRIIATRIKNGIKPAWNKGKKNPYTEETLKRMGESQKLRLSTTPHPMLGRKQSAEVVANMSKKVVQYDLDGGLIKEWKSIAEAQRQLKISHISCCCNGKRKFAGGFIWKHKGQK